MGSQRTPTLKQTVQSTTLATASARTWVWLTISSRSHRHKEVSHAVSMVPICTLNVFLFPSSNWSLSDEVSVAAGVIHDGIVKKQQQKHWLLCVFMKLDKIHFPYHNPVAYAWIVLVSSERGLLKMAVTSTCFPFRKDNISILLKIRIHCWCRFLHQIIWCIWFVQAHG